MNLAPDTIVITGLGMVSSIGYDVETSCASARAGISRASELPYCSVYNEESAELEPVVGHAMTGFSDGFAGLGRLIHLGNAALANLLENAEIDGSHLSSVGCFVNLSSGYHLSSLHRREREEIKKLPGYDERSGDSELEELETQRVQWTDSLIPRLCELNGIVCNKEYQKTYFGDQVGVLVALAEATSLLQSKRVSQCIIGGVDSFVEQEALEGLLGLGVLKTHDNPNGVVPGEAAAFVLMERYDTAVSRQARIQGIVHRPSIKLFTGDQFSDAAREGRALSDIVIETIEGLSDKEKNVGLIICDLNGVEWRAREWGNTLLRLPRSLLHVPQWYCANYFGEIGAATGTVAFCMAVRAFQRGYAHTENVLILVSADGGGRGGVCVRDFHNAGAK